MLDGFFYVYIIFRPNGIPCYVGKGKGKRAERHSKLKKHHPNKHLSSIFRLAGGTLPVVIVHEGLQEADAFLMEIAFIRAIGREKDGGPLVNQTDGGEGVTGLVHSEKARNIMSAKVRAHNSTVTVHPNLGLKRSDETRAKQRALKLGIKQKPEMVEARIAPLRGRSRPQEVRDKISAAQVRRWIRWHDQKARANGENRQGP